MSSIIAHDKINDWQNKLQEKFKEAKEDFSNNNTDNKWEFVREVNNTKIHKNTSTSFWKWKGEGTFTFINEINKIQTPIDVLINYIARDNIEFRKLWDPDCLVSRFITWDEVKLTEESILKELPKQYALAYQVFNTNNPFVSNREFVIHRDIYLEDDGNVAYFIVQSLSDVPGYEDKKAPYDSSYVRGKVNLVAFRVELIKDVSNNETNRTYKIGMISHNEPGGWVGSSVYNVVSEKQVHNVYRIAETIKKGL
ncbi:hypothetical protein ABK040_001896 [Willaertia magna]